MSKQRRIFITKVITATASLVLVGSVSAATDAEIYHGFADGNPDLSTEFGDDSVRTSVQPGVGDSFDSYHDWAKGNPDLYSGTDVGSRRVDSGLPEDFDIYHGIAEGNPDL